MQGISRYANDDSWTSKRDLPTGRLCLQAYSPYPRAQWVKQWRETKDHDLGSQIKAIIKGLEHAAPEIANLVAEGERQAKIEYEKWEIQRAQWRQEEAERLAAKALKDSKEDIYRIIDQWAEANRIEQFFTDAERQAVDLEDEERIRLLDRLKRARELIGTVDALGHFMIWKAPEER